MSTVLNRSSVKKYALAISAARRASKFERVGLEFILSCEAKLETGIRQLAGDLTEAPGHGELKFVTATARAKATEKLELLAKKIIYAGVMAHPSLGKTLK